MSEHDDYGAEKSATAGFNSNTSDTMIREALRAEGKSPSQITHYLRGWNKVKHKRSV